MKNYIVYPKRELMLWLVMFLLSNFLNVYSIMHYKTSWTELYSQLGYVFAMSLVLYIVVTLIRRIVVLTRRKNEA